MFCRFGCRPGFGVGDRQLHEPDQHRMLGQLSVQTADRHAVRIV